MDCAKGKARHPDEFGANAALVVTNKEGLAVSALSVWSNAA
jgi:hypothetical protein